MNDEELRLTILTEVIRLLDKEIYRNSCNAPTICTITAELVGYVRSGVLPGQPVTAPVA